MPSTLEMIQRLDLTPLADSNIVVYSNMRNEIVRVRAWLDHYRRMGIRRFMVIDNASSDGTYELLSAQPDVMAIRTEESFAAANYGVSWLNGFRQRLMERHWVLTADADEFLAYRDWPRVSLQKFISRVETASSDSVIGCVLDMYPGGPLAEATGIPQTFDELLRLAPFFDTRYVFTIKKRKPWAKSPKLIDFIGGPRTRILSSIERETRQGWIEQVLYGQIDRIIDWMPTSFLPFLARYWPRQTPRLTKVPLVRGGDRIQFTDNHSAAPLRPYCENVILLHFKYLADFVARVASEIAREEHYRRGLEYLMYADMLKQRGDISLWAELSARLGSGDDLIKLELIRNIFQTYVHS